MKAIIPVAGEGTRLRPHTFTRPKCLLEVGGQAILDHILDALEPVGVREAVLIVGYKGDAVRRHLEQNPRPSMRCVCVEQPQPLGLGHAVLQAAPHIDDQPLLIIYGDTLFETDIAAAINLGVSALGTIEIEKPDAFGVVFLNEQGVVTKLVEKPPGLPRGEIIVGVNIIRESRQLMEALRTRFEHGRTGAKGEYQLTDAFQDLVEAGVTMRTFPVYGWYDCGNRAALLASNRYLLEKDAHRATLPETCVGIFPYRVAPSAVVARSVIGPNVTIGEHAVVADAVLRDTIVHAHARVSGVCLDSSIVGRGATVQGGSLVADVGDNTVLNTRGAAS